jgi:hypothetical protein
MRAFPRDRTRSSSKRLTLFGLKRRENRVDLNSKANHSGLGEVKKLRIRLIQLRALFMDISARMECMLFIKMA